jgi:hypothetical protein
MLRVTTMWPMRKHPAILPDMLRSDSAIVSASVVLAVALFGLHEWQFTDYIADDAAITFAYAKNLARGHGLVLNPGTDPVEGYSNFAWLLVVLPFCARGTDPTWPIKALSFVLGAATLAGMTLVAQQLSTASKTAGHRWLAGVAALGLAGFTPFVVWASAGLENGFYCALFVGALLLYLRQSWLACAAMLVLLSLTRVEGVGLAGLFVVHRAGVLAFDRVRPSRKEIAAALTFVAGYGVYSAWHWWYFRAFLPNTYLAKSPAINHGVSTDTLLTTVGRGWNYALEQLVIPYHMLWVAPLAIAGLMRLRLRMLTLMLLLSAGLWAIVLVTGGDFYPQFRLGTIVLPLSFLLVAEGARVAVSRFGRPAAAALAIIPLLVVWQPGVAVATSWGRGPISMGGLKPILADRYKLIAERIRRRPITVLESDIGNVAYFTDYAIVDLGGLANLHIAMHGLGSPMFLHYVFEEAKPDVIHLRDMWAANANIPIPLLERDYQRIEGQPVAPFADGWYIRRDRDFPYGPLQRVPSGDGPERTYVDAQGVMWTGAADDRWIRNAVQPNLRSEAAGHAEPLEFLSATFAPQPAGAAAIHAQIRQLCTERPDDCHADPALAAHALAEARAHQRAGRFGDAFNWYAAAFDGDRRNIVALRAREQMRRESARLCAPGAPDGVQFAVNGGDVTIRWLPSAPLPVAYLVEAGSASGRSDLAQLRSSGPSLTVPGVAPRTYFVRIKAENACGQSRPSNEVVIVVR